MTTPVEKPVQVFNLDDPEVHANPYPAYRWLRENAPVYHLPGTPMWVLSRYQDIARVLHDHETFSSYPGMDVPMMSLPVKDPPSHPAPADREPGLHAATDLDTGAPHGGHRRGTHRRGPRRLRFHHRLCHPPAAHRHL
jgi:cytochrome P450